MCWIKLIKLRITPRSPVDDQNSSLVMNANDWIVSLASFSSFKTPQNIGEEEDALNLFIFLFFTVTLSFVQADH